MRQVAISRGPCLVCERCLVAETYLSRLRGLLGRGGLRLQEGILIQPASAIHTCFMRFAIDAVFLGGDFTVLSVVPGLRPWRAAANPGARAVLELAEGECRRLDIRPGDRLGVT